jgi:predicted RNA-binding protein YlqC (UPF0109 family)
VAQKRRSQYLRQSGFSLTVQVWKKAIMKDLIEYIAKSLVDHPDEVQVRQSGTGSRVRIELSVSKDDMGRVIGKGGKVANSIRTLLRVAAEREGKQATLDVVEPE